MLVGSVCFGAKLLFGRKPSGFECRRLRDLQVRHARRLPRPQLPSPAPTPKRSLRRRGEGWHDTQTRLARRNDRRVSAKRRINTAHGRVRHGLEPKVIICGAAGAVFGSDPAMSGGLRTPHHHSGSPSLSCRCFPGSSVVFVPWYKARRGKVG